MKSDQQDHRSNAHFDDTRTHNIDYQSWKMQLIQTRWSDEYRVNTDEMDLNTMYYSELTSKPLLKVMGVKWRGVDVRFDGITTYFGDYWQ
jgi:hypothetical protein